MTFKKSHRAESVLAVLKNWNNLSGQEIRSICLIRWLAASDFDRATIDVSGYFSTLLQYLESEVVRITNLAARLVVALE